MKLQFVLPGDQIKLLEDGKITIPERNTRYTPDFLEMWDRIEKDTVLEVNQVYIRKESGWFGPSLTFKFISGHGYERYKEEYLLEQKKNIQNSIDGLYRQLNDLQDNNADWKVESEWKMTETGWNPTKIQYIQGSKKDFENRRTGRDARYTMHKDWYLKEIKKEEKRLLNAKVPMSKNFQRVIRVPLTDIQNWEVEIVK